MTGGRRTWDSNTAAISEAVPTPPQAAPTVGSASASARSLKACGSGALAPQTLGCSPPYTPVMHNVTISGLSGWATGLQQQTERTRIPCPYSAARDQGDELPGRLVDLSQTQEGAVGHTAIVTKLGLTLNDAKSQAKVLTRQNGDCTLRWDRIWERFGDLFATAEMSHCPLWFSPRSYRGPLGVDALAHESPKALLYAFPPILLLSAFLKKVRRDKATVLLVAPRWPRRFCSNLCQLLQGQPWEIPLCMDLLSQVKDTLWHPELGRLQLWVWPLNGTVCPP
ncbi:UNVERIFIED_CONTAM: hypothetical protein FKN15_028339 [Acipenser sinensis]